MKTRQKLLLIENRKAEKGWFLGIAVVLMLLFSTGVVRGQSTGTTIRWDVASFVTPTTIAPGGVANAFADDGSKITMTGAGTFVTSRFSKGPLAGISFRVTGGGNWQTFDAQGNSTGSGTYKVRRLDRFEAAPGSLVGSGLTDTIGDLANARAGLALFALEYSDGSRGTLVFSCFLGPPAPPSMFEGMTATKGFLDYWNREDGKPIFTADQTVFHVVPRKD